jgi:hypothetical protein
MRSKNGIAQKEENLLRRNNPTQRMAPRQHNPAMIHLRRWPTSLRQASPLNQCPSTSRAPVGQGFFVNHRPALTANSLHTQKTTRSLHFPQRISQFSASSFAENSLSPAHNWNWKEDHGSAQSFHSTVHNQGTPATAHNQFIIWNLKITS